MTRGFTLHVCALLIIFPCMESSYLPCSIKVAVPQTIAAGYVIAKVDDHRDTNSLHLSDQDFKVQSDGTIVAASNVTISQSGRTFSVWAEVPSGQIKKMHICLFHNTIQKREAPGGFLKRSKRRWSPPPFNIIENDVPPFPKQLDQIGSDSSATRQVYYVISGPGVTEDPVGLFSVDKFTGMLSVHGPVDREVHQHFIFQAQVYDRYTHVETDAYLDVRVEVDDVNDNAPTFTSPLQFTVLEKSQTGTVVGKVNATDRDDKETEHTKIQFSLLSGTDLFAIGPETGVIRTVSQNLDREVKATHLVTVQIKDMGGKPIGLSNTATATIRLGDINDNPPTFTKTSFKANVEENQGEGLILRIPVEDKDLVNTPNWISQFVITSGNENGNFRIERDPATNDGLLYITKPLDYEQTKDLKLKVMARNQAELSGTTASWLSVPVDVSVGNLDEGPEFTAPTVRFIVKENTPNGTVIGTYNALDPETKSGAGIKYYKVTDPASWIRVDVNSGELKVANTIDRESHFVQDGVYNITMKAVDASMKTGTGTVIIQVEDDNDHVPEFPVKELVVCEKEGVLGSVLAVADDKDQSPYAAPFSFELADKGDSKWAVKEFNATAAWLVQAVELPTGIYNVPLVVKDLQGLGGKQTVAVRICRCRNEACLPKERSIALGKWGILALLLGLALVLLLCLCCALFCVTKGDAMKFEEWGDSGGILLKSNIEAPGDKVDCNFLPLPSTGLEQSIKGGSTKGSLHDMAWQGNKSSNTIGGFSVNQNTLRQSSGALLTDAENRFSSQYEGSQFTSGQYGAGQFANGGTMTRENGHSVRFQGSSAHDAWQTSGRFIQQKLAYLAGEEEGRYADDILHSYGFEGVGSPAGSVGCCSDQGNQDNLDFLNTLSPKFKTLAELCTKK